MPPNRINLGNGGENKKRRKAEILEKESDLL